MKIKSYEYEIGNYEFKFSLKYDENELEFGMLNHLLYNVFKKYYVKEFTKENGYIKVRIYLDNKTECDEKVLIEMIKNCTYCFKYHNHKNEVYDIWSGIWTFCELSESN